MQSVSFRPRARTYRHELHTLTYVTLDGANGGIIRNLNHDGVAVQAVGRLRQDQRVRLRFELRFPRLRVEAYGNVSWSSSAGQCGIRFVDLPEHTSNQIDEWIFANLLDSLYRANDSQSIFKPAVIVAETEDATASNSGLILSAEGRTPIALKAMAARSTKKDVELNWLSRLLSPRTLAWLVDSLVLFAGLLLFALIFLSVAHELPSWQLTLSGALAAAALVAAGYWTLFAIFGGPSVGARLAQVASGIGEEKEDDGVGRFR